MIQVAKLRNLVGRQEQLFQCRACLQVLDGRYSVLNEAQLLQVRTLLQALNPLNALHEVITKSVVNACMYVLMMTLRH